jgi:predicted DNA-binding transcriptional regulator AlpA
MGQPTETRAAQPARPRAINATELCRVLGGISTTTLKNYRRRDPTFPKAFRVGPRGRWLFHEDEVLRWLEARREGARA